MNSIPQDDIPQKYCIACGKPFPATPGFFYRRKEAKDGLRAACISCENPLRKPPKEPVPEGMKRCSRCPNIYPATHEFFNKKKSTKDGLRAECKTCQRANGKAYDDAHVEDKKRYAQGRKEEKRAYNQLYHSTHREEIHRMRKRWYQLHREEMYEYQKRYREAHRDYMRERYRQYKTQYRKTERGQMVMRAESHRRRIREKAMEGTLTAQQIRDKLRLQRFRCYYCHKKFKKDEGIYAYELEHTIPVSRTEHNPRHDINYVVLSCSPCNLKKHNKLPHEWFEGGRLF